MRQYLWNSSALMLSLMTSAGRGISHCGQCNRCHCVDLNSAIIESPRHWLQNSGLCRQVGVTFLLGNWYRGLTSKHAWQFLYGGPARPSLLIGQSYSCSNSVSMLYRASVLANCRIALVVSHSSSSSGGGCVVAFLSASTLLVSGGASFWGSLGAGPLHIVRLPCIARVDAELSYRHIRG